MFIKGLIVLSVLALVDSEELCSCAPDRTEQDFEDFKRFREKFNLVEEDIYPPVYPGEISPLVPCECEAERIKRGVVTHGRHGHGRGFGLRKYHGLRFRHLKRNGCAYNMVRVGFICV